MKNFFKKAKKTMTLGVAKVKSGVSSDAKKKENEDPQFIEQTEKLRSLKAECTKVIRTLVTLQKDIEALSMSLETSGNSFGEIIKPDCSPYYQFSSKSQEGIHELNKYMHNFSSYYLKNTVMKPLDDMNEELDFLNVIREKRKKNKVLLQQEEKHLKSAQEKNKDVDQHVEKTRLRREKYDRYNTQFLTGVASLYDRRSEIFGKAFDVYQFYLAELVELQEKCIKQNLSNFQMGVLRNQIPSCSSKPQLNISAQPSPYSSPYETGSSGYGQFTQYQAPSQFQPPEYNSFQQVTVQTPNQTPVQTPNQVPVQNPSQVPVQNPSQVPVQNPDQVPVQTPMQVPVQTPVQAPAAQVPQNPSQAPSDATAQSQQQNQESFNIPLNPYPGSDQSVLPNKSSELF